MNTSLYQTIKIKKINFIGISSLISWANTFEIREFRPKMENFHQHLNFFHDVYTEKKIMISSIHHTIKIENFNFFLGFHHLFRGPTPLKFENFDQKLKTSTITQIFHDV